MYRHKWGVGGRERSQSQSQFVHMSCLLIFVSFILHSLILLRNLKSAWKTQGRKQLWKFNQKKKISKTWTQKHLQETSAYLFSELEPKISGIREFSANNQAWKASPQAFLVDITATDPFGTVTSGTENIIFLQHFFITESISLQQATHNRS
jgi:hypothetical protein